VRALAGLALSGFVAFAAAAAPSREDHGDLVVLRVEGSYREMGRQQAELLGPLGRAVFDFNRADYARSVAEAGFAARLFDRAGMPIASALLRRDESGMGEQIAGIASGLGVAPREAMRAGFALDAASTVFVATRSATADGAPLIGRNADWGDAGGLRRPVVTVYRPTNGDLAHAAAGWPLLTLPVIGLNEAGFALSMNFFETEPLLRPFGGSWPHRRALQTARTVEDGIRIFAEAGADIAFACFMAMADASGAIALLECRPGDGCAVFRPVADWFAHANHARSAAMIPHDRYRSPDSFARQRDMENSVGRFLGRLTPELATQVLRDRTGHRYPNDTSVANLFVLNAAVIAPKDGILWHSTAMQPDAPFGSYVGVSLAQETSAIRVLPAAEREPEARRDEAKGILIARSGVQMLRAAVEADDAETRRVAYETAEFAWETLARWTEQPLDPARIALGQALALHGKGDLEGAYAALAPAEASEAPFEARAEGLASRALLADRLGRREEALRLWRATLAHLDSAPEYNVFGGLRRLAEGGLVRPARAGELPIQWWDLGVPR
jgi:tetratricopeptide (TPR) repeat protein